MIHAQLQDEMSRLRQLSVDTLYTASQSLLNLNAATVADELTVTADARGGSRYRRVLFTGDAKGYAVITHIHFSDLQTLTGTGTHSHTRTFNPVSIWVRLDKMS